MLLIAFQKRYEPKIAVSLLTSPPAMFVSECQCTMTLGYAKNIILFDSDKTIKSQRVLELRDVQ